MSEISRRNALSAAAWSVPVVAVAVAAPAMAVSGDPTVELTGFTAGINGLQILNVSFRNIPTRYVRARLTYSPSGPTLSGASFVYPPIGDSTETFILRNITPGVEYTFTVTLSEEATGYGVLVHTF